MTMTLENLRADVDAILGDLDDPALRGDVWEAAMLILDYGGVNVENGPWTLHELLIEHDSDALFELKQVADRVGHGVEALRRLIDAAELAMPQAVPS